MMIILEGYNDFYDGWLAGLFRLPQSPDNSGFQMGWKTAIETGSPHAASIALIPEIEHDHVIVHDAMTVEGMKRVLDQLCEKGFFEDIVEYIVNNTDIAE